MGAAVKYDFELELAVQWSNTIHNKMKANNIDTTQDDYFHKLEALKWTDRTCKKCGETIFTKGNTRLCTVCQSRYAGFTEDGLIYGI